MNNSWNHSHSKLNMCLNIKGCCGRDHMVVGFTTTYAISANLQ